MFTKLLILVLLISLAVFSAYFITQSPAHQKSPLQSPIPSPSPTIPPQSSLYFSPETMYAKKGIANSADILINTQGKYPTLLQLELAYDPAALTNVSLIPASLIPDPNVLLNLVDEKNGRISFAFGLKPNQKPQAFSGTVAKIYFYINKYSDQHQTSIYFLPKTSILSDELNIPLKIATGLKVILQAPVASASQTFR